MSEQQRGSCVELLQAKLPTDPPSPESHVIQIFEKLTPSLHIMHNLPYWEEQQWTQSYWHVLWELSKQGNSLPIAGP